MRGETIEGIAARRLARALAGKGDWRDTLGAVSFARLTAAEEGVLRVYAGDLRRWPIVEHYMLSHGHSRTAAADAMNRLLWRRPDVCIASRARELKIRRSSYSAQVQAARSELSGMLRTSASRVLKSLRGTEFHPPVSRIVNMEPNYSAPVPCRGHVGEHVALNKLKLNGVLENGMLSSKAGRLAAEIVKRDVSR